MADCKYKKRLQYYLDGWIDKRGSRDLEKHLKHCAECQIELTNLEELNSAALEIVDQAPEKEYWDSFSARVRNRIIARNVEPVREESRRPRFLALRMVSIFSTLIIIIGAISLLLSYQINLPSMKQTPISGTINSSPNDSIQSQNPGGISSELLLAADGNAASGMGTINPVSSRGSVSHRPTQDNIVPLVMTSGYQSLNTGNLSSLEMSDPASSLRTKPIIGKTHARLLTDYESPSFASNSNQEAVDPSFRLKSSYVDQRLLADLSSKSGDMGLNAYSGALNSVNAASTGTAWNSSGNDISYSWGYLSVPADTSLIGDLKKYYIELELMQAK
jgi:hypothetical protein